MKPMRFVKNAMGQQHVYGAARSALVTAARDLRADLVTSGTMPLQSGHLQNTATIVDTSNAWRGEVAVVSDTVYARRKFFNPQFQFDRSVNKSAGGRWFDVYISGDKRRFALKAFAGAMRKKA